jgi:hypothetical protein
MPASIAHSLWRPARSLPIQTFLTFHAVGCQPALAVRPVTAIPAPDGRRTAACRSVPLDFELLQGGRSVSS